MKKILFSLVALVASMSMNAQVMKVMKNGEEVAKYDGAEYSVVFEEEAPETTGTTKATINNQEVDVNWVQLWEDGPKFAEYNVGVTDGKAESYGGLYAWGGNQDKVVDDHNTGTDALTGDNDTATKLWGTAWRMPTQAELEALLANCDVEWTTVNGVNGSKYTGKGDYSSNSVFFPAGGCFNGRVVGQGVNGFYWSSAPNGSDNARYLYFGSGYAYVLANAYRNNGLSVRAVLAEEPESTTTGTAKATIGSSEVDVNWVQLWAGGPKFADRNVAGTMTFTQAIADPFTWGSNWCTPSKADLEELVKAASNDADERNNAKVTCTYEQVEGVWGFTFTGKEDGYTNNSVFFPAKDGDSDYGGASYCSGTAVDGTWAWRMRLDYDGISGLGLDSNLGSGRHDFGYLVRPVLKEN